MCIIHLATPITTTIAFCNICCLVSMCWKTTGIIAFYCTSFCVLSMHQLHYSYAQFWHIWLSDAQRNHQQGNVYGNVCGNAYFYRRYPFQAVSNQGASRPIGRLAVSNRSSSRNPTNPQFSLQQYSCPVVMSLLVATSLTSRV